MAKQVKKSALDLIREVHGSGAVFGGNESIHFSVSATSTGSLNLDAAIGCGGIPDGRITLWSGPESSGKTLGSLCYAKKKQQEGKRILFIDAECTWDHNWASMLGLKVDAQSMLIAQESSGIKIFDLLCGKPKSKNRKNAIPGILSAEILKQMEDEGAPLGAIILDSINAVVPPLEQDMETGDQQIGSLSRFLPPMLRRLSPLLKDHSIPLIAICQARTNIGQMKGDPLTVSGGKALMHAASLWLDSRKVNGSDIYSSDDSNEEKPIGHQVRIKVRKNKVGAPGRKAELTIYYTRGVDLRPELLDQGIERGLIRQEGQMLYYSGFEGGKVRGQNNAITEIFNNKKLAQRLLEDVLNHRINEDRENKRDSSDFVEEETEEAIVGHVTHKFEESEVQATITSSEKAQPKITILEDGTRVDTSTGVVIENRSDEEEVVTELDLEDDEEEIVTVSDSETENSQGDIEVAIPERVAPSGISLSDVDNLTFKELKDAAKEAGVKGWYKLTSDELREVLKNLRKE